MSYKKLAVGALLTFAIAACEAIHWGPINGSGGSESTEAPTPPGPTQNATITVSLDKPGPQINSAMWGAFFEDINFGADGGLYAEFVKNRSFEFPDGMMGWTSLATNVSDGEITVRNDNPFKATNPHYLRISSKSWRSLGIANEGFRGMGFKGGDGYDFSAQAHIVDGSPKVTINLVAKDGTTLASAPLTGITSSWSKVTAMNLKPSTTDAKGRLTVVVEGPGTVDFDMVSLFPQKTWMNRPGGLRADMVQTLADLHPGFLRFPGGCIVEGSTLAHRYQWKNTIGPIEDRQLLVNRWNNEFPWRPTPDYYQTFGLGFFEYFQLCEDIGAQPLPLLNCGMACEFNSNELCPIPELGPYIQDALDLIEFANGPATSTWGAKRAAMGHPAPFNMKLLGIGNEQWGPQYLERLALFTKEIKAKYPDINLVSAAGPSPDDDRFDFLWPKLNEMKADIVDQHCYANPPWFLSSSTRFDNYDRKGPKVFFGEYGAQSVAICSPKNKNDLECALSEAAFMTGLERNADVVRMASYAPLFSNIDAWQWTPDLMWTNSLQTIPSANYYVQQMYTKNRGDIVLPATNNAPIHDVLPAGRIGVGVSLGTAEFKDIKVTRGGATVWSADFTKPASDWTGGGNWSVKDGAYQQTDINADTMSSAGDKTWTDYTLTLKARQTGTKPRTSTTNNGISVTVYDNGAGSYAQWILGGWDNTQHGIQTHYAEQDQLLNRVPGTIEPNRWYDIQITVKGDHMECSLDGKVIQSAEILHHHVPSLFTTASRDEKTGETILKVVNPDNHATAATIQLHGATSVQSSAEAITLTGNLHDENTFDKPSTVAPVTTKFGGVQPEFTYTFQPQSFTVLRLQTPRS